MKKKRPDDTIRKRICFLFLAVLVLFVGMAIFHHEKRKYALHDRVIEMEHFRSMQAGGSLQEETAELQKQSGLSKGKLLALAFAGAQASFPKKMPTIDELQQTAKWMYRYRPKQYEMLENAFCAVWDDLVCFPVKCRVSYEDSWMEERTYGGKRGHEGTDLMPPTNQRGFYPVFSATAGTVEHMGWLQKGGWRIGIRSEQGGYFYYAHLSEYAPGMEEGKTVEAGEMLGYMGDSGYGEEGTSVSLPYICILAFTYRRQTGGKSVSILTGS